MFFLREELNLFFELSVRVWGSIWQFFPGHIPPSKAPTFLWGVAMGQTHPLPFPGGGGVKDQTHLYLLRKVLYLLNESSGTILGSIWPFLFSEFDPAHFIGDCYGSIPLHRSPFSSLLGVAKGQNVKDCCHSTTSNVGPSSQQFITIFNVL